MNHKEKFLNKIHCNILIISFEPLLGAGNDLMLMSAIKMVNMVDVF